MLKLLLLLKAQALQSPVLGHTHGIASVRVVLERDVLFAFGVGIETVQPAEDFKPSVSSSWPRVFDADSEDAPSNNSSSVAAKLPLRCSVFLAIRTLRNPVLGKEVHSFPQVTDENKLQVSKETDIFWKALSVCGGWAWILGRTNL